MTRRSEWFRLAVILVAAAGLMAANMQSSTSTSVGRPVLHRCGDSIKKTNSTGNPWCGAGQYCDKTGKACPIKGGPGVCRPKPQNCQDTRAPVCGCDDNTYANACAAAAKGGVSVKHQGACRPGEVNTPNP